MGDKKFEEINLKKKDKLCERGFLIVSQCIDAELPYYVKDWNKTDVSGFSFYVHENQTLFYKSTDNELYFLIGHAYNPFTNAIKEERILEEWVECRKRSYEDQFDYIDSLTGIFVLGIISHNRLSVLLDCAGMMSGFYGTLNNGAFITSHTVIAAETFNLKRSEYVKELLNYKFYHLYGSFLPGDITPYENVYRIVPNTFVTINLSTYQTKVNRFYPNSPIKMICTEEEYRKQLQKIADIFQNSMRLISQKWKKPAISMTGGMDSKTTLAAAKGLYDKFVFFSYVSSKAEKIDADAARDICDSIGVLHNTYNISPNPDNYPDFEITKSILFHNKDYIGKNNVNDVCKREYFSCVEDFDIEVKSWVSEIARANYYKKFGKRKMPKSISPRRCSSMYKIFLHNRTLLRKTDEIFANYINKTSFLSNIYNYDWSDLFLWEIRYGAWGGLVITAEHKYSFDITIPYNNRKLLDLMLAVPLDKRRKDELHNDLIKLMNKKIFDTGISVVNLNETKLREICEKIYFNVNTFLPF